MAEYIDDKDAEKTVPAFGLKDIKDLGTAVGQVAGDAFYGLAGQKNPNAIPRKKVYGNAVEPEVLPAAKAPTARAPQSAKVLPVASRPVKAPTNVASPVVPDEAALIAQGKIAPRGQGVDASFAPLTATVPAQVQPAATAPETFPSTVPGVGIYTGKEGEPTYTNTVKSSLTDEQNANIVTQNRQAAGDAYAQLERNNILRNAADAVTRAFNQPTKENLKAAAIAQGVLRDAGVNDVDFKKLFSEQGVNDAQIAHWGAQSEMLKKQAAILPGSFKEKEEADLKRVEAGKASPKITLKDIVDAARVETVDEMGNKTSNLDMNALRSLAKEFGVLPGDGGVGKEKAHELSGQKPGRYNVNGRVIKWDGVKEIA